MYSGYVNLKIVSGVGLRLGRIAVTVSVLDGRRLGKVVNKLGQLWLWAVLTNQFHSKAGFYSRTAGK